VGRIVVLGESIAVDAYALAGATVVRAEDADAARRAWAALPGDVAVVVLTAAAAVALASVDTTSGDVLTIDMPQAAKA
jgi:vacuolar-type H+-ATPase subunit F/Vma7